MIGSGIWVYFLRVANSVSQKTEIIASNAISEGFYAVVVLYASGEVNRMMLALDILGVASAILLALPPRINIITRNAFIASPVSVLQTIFFEGNWKDIGQSHFVAPSNVVFVIT